MLPVPGQDHRRIRRSAAYAPFWHPTGSGTSRPGVSSEGNHRTYPEPAVPLLACRQFTPEHSDPLTQSAQAAATGQAALRACRKRYRSGVVDHLNLDVTAPVADPDRGRLPGAVLDGVGQAFLHYPVHGQSHADGPRGLTAVLDQFHRLPAHPSLLH